MVASDNALQEWHLFVIPANDWSMETRTQIHSPILRAPLVHLVPSRALKTLFLFYRDTLAR